MAEIFDIYEYGIGALSSRLILVPNTPGATPFVLDGADADGDASCWIAPGGLSLPIPSFDEPSDDGPDTEGSRPTRSTPKGGTATVSMLIKAESDAGFYRKIQQWENAVDETRRNGGMLVYTPENGAQVTYDVATSHITEMPSSHIQLQNRVAQAACEFPCLPFARMATQTGYPLTDVDPFNRDSLTNQEWRFDGGIGTLSVAGSMLIPTSTATKLMYRPYNVEDATAYMKIVAGASPASGSSGIEMKRLSSSSLLRFKLFDIGTNTGAISFYKYTGSETSLASSSTYPVVAGATYYGKVQMVGNVITANVYTTDPLGSNPTAPIKSLTYTLTGGDATTWGAGIKGQPGMRLFPQATDWQYGAWRLDSAWIESFDAQVRFELYDIPGSASALIAVNVTDTAVGGAARRHVEVAVDDDDFLSYAPVPTLIDSDVMTPIAGAQTNRSGYDPGASGNNVISLTLGTTQAAICTTGPQVHLGPRKIKARVFATAASAGPIYVRLAYRIGDGSWQRNSYAQLPATGSMYEVDLGTISLPDALVAGQTWEGRIEAYSATSGDVLDIDLLHVLPAKRFAKVKSTNDLGVQQQLLVERFQQAASADLDADVTGGSGTQLAYNPSGPTGINDTASNYAWTNPNTISAYDGSYAYNTSGFAGLHAGGYWSYFLKAHTFNFSIPASAAIQGIQINVYKQTNLDPVVNGYATMGDQWALIQKTGADQPDNKAQGWWPYNYWGLTSYGGPTDKWGTTWTDANINATGTGGFCFRIQNYWWAAAELGFAYNPTAYVNQVYAIVWYIASGSLTWAVSSASVISVDDPLDRAKRSSAGDTPNTVAGMSTGGKAAIIPNHGPFTDIGVATTVYKDDQAAEAAFWRGGVLARTGSTAATALTTHVFAGFEDDLASTPSIPQRIAIWRRHPSVASGAGVLLQAVPYAGTLSGGRRIWLAIDAKGNYFVWVGTPPVLVIGGQDTELATGGNLASGRQGFYDFKSASLTPNRYYDDYEVWVPDFAGAAIPAASKLTIKEDAAFSPSGGRPPYEGPFMKVNQAGNPDRSAQLVVKARRNDIDLLPDDTGASSVFDLTRVSVDLTPRAQLL